jgi:hypothetical protein
VEITLPDLVSLFTPAENDYLSRFVDKFLYPFFLVCVAPSSPFSSRSSSYSHGDLTLTGPRINRDRKVRKRTEDAEIRHFCRHNHLNRLPRIRNVGSMAAERPYDRQVGYGHRVRRSFRGMARFPDDSAKKRRHSSYGSVCSCASRVR